MKNALTTCEIPDRILNFKVLMADVIKLRFLLTGLLMLCGVLPVQGQLINTHSTLGAKAQIMLHLDQLESTWGVKEARKEQAKKGSAPGVEAESAIPGDLQLGLQLKAIQGDLDFELYPGVRDFVQLFAKRKRHAMEAVMGLQPVYFPAIEKELASRGMPDNLKYLPVVLSCLNTRAVAEGGATGLWQLPFHVGIRYGLVCDENMDERRDPVKATRAALSWLNSLHDLYGDWTLAMTAFTCGPGGVQRARNRTGNSKDFEALYPYLPQNTRDYIPAFMAAAYVLRYHLLFGMQALEIHAPPHKDILQLSEPIAFSPVAQVLRIPEEELRAYNPSCRTATIPFTGATVQICLPAGYGARFSQLKDSIYALQKRLQEPPQTNPAPSEKDPEPPLKNPLPSPEPPTNSEPIRYTIQRGDNLGAIARWFEVRLTELKAWNGLENDNIRAGDVLTLHVPKAEAARLRKIAGMSLEEKEAMKGQSSPPKTVVSETKPPAAKKYQTYTVKQGDSLWAIAQKYPGVSPEEIMRANGITEDIHPGMKLKIPTPAQ